MEVSNGQATPLYWGVIVRLATKAQLNGARWDGRTSLAELKVLVHDITSNRHRVMRQCAGAVLKVASRSR